MATRRPVQRRKAGRAAPRPARAPSGHGDAARPQEIELKLALPASALPALRRRLAELGAGERQGLHTIYFDTAERLLARHAIALRLRRAGARWLQTLKLGDPRAALTARGEWEMAVPSARLQLGRLRATPLPALLAAHGEPPLQPLFSTRFTRIARRVEVGRSVVEVALDRGWIDAGRGADARRVPLLELELELKAGRPRALFKLARRLLDGDDRRAPLPLVPCTESKAARGLRLLDGRAPAVAPANRIGAGLEAHTGVDRALRQVVAQAVDVLLANAQAAGEHDDPEYLHQARVALRRLRSALRLWRRGSDFPRPLLDELRWLGGVCGAARDADVLVGETLPALAAVLPAAQRRALQALLARVQQQRTQARDRMLAAFASARYARLTLTLLAWAARAPDAAAPALRKRARRQLAAAQARVLSAAQFFAAQDAARRHRLRIQVKRLRYALDLFAPALPPARVAEYGDRLARLQTLLGQMNDSAVALAALSASGAPAGLQRAAGLALRGRDAPLLAAAEQALEALARTQPPWLPQAAPAPTPG